MRILAPFLLIFGFVVPGWFVARWSSLPLQLPAAFVSSLLILFHAVFWVGVAGFPVQLSTVLPCLVAAAIAGAWLTRRSAPPAAVDRQATALERTLVVSTTLVVVALLAGATFAPLPGPDTMTRWDFLARRMLAVGSFDFYPPLAAADFRHYFFPDGIPPLVPFAHWWIHVSAGRPAAELTGVFSAAQLAATLAFVYGSARALFTPRAAVLAVAIAAASPLLLRAVLVGQEAGLLSLSMAGTLYFASVARAPRDPRAVVMAGLAAGVGALAREFGWITVLGGALALAWRRLGPRSLALFGAVALAVALPWYLRNWILAGNPVYPLRLAGFAVNPVYDALLEHGHAVLDVRVWPASRWRVAGLFLVLWAPLQLLAGIPGTVAGWRRHGYLLVIAVVVAAVWIRFVGYTLGGLAMSMRVFAPAVVALSIAAGGALEPLLRRRAATAVALAAVVALQLWTAGHALLYPAHPLSVPLRQWPQQALAPHPPPSEEQLGDDLVGELPPGSRVLSDSPYLHAALVEHGVEVVPVWSPEVRFLFELPAEQADQRLRSLGIAAVAVYPGTINTHYLVRASPFYAVVGRRWELVARVPDVLDVYVAAGI